MGETVTYELGRGKDGKPQAVNVYRQALGKPSTYPRERSEPTRSSHVGRSPVNAALVALVLVLAIGALGYSQYQRHWVRPQAAAAILPSPEAVGAEPVLAGYRCDGRTHCSQMDGNHDGVPCEQQWCTSPFAK